MLRDLWPETRERRDSVHKLVNALDVLPKSVRRGPSGCFAEIRNAEDRGHTAAAAERSDVEFGVSGPRPPQGPRRLRQAVDVLRLQPSIGCT